MIEAARAIVARRELVLDFAWRDLRSRYKGSLLGFAWNFVIPLLQLVVFWILFGVLLETRPLTATGEKPYPIFLFVGLLPWTYFSNALQSGAASIVANAAIVKRVRMPVQLLPASALVSALANFLLGLVVVAAVLAVFGPRHPEGIVYVPLLLLVQTVLALGLAYVLAAANVFFRDIEHILGVLLMAWYFLTPVLFPISVVGDRPAARALLELNPMTGVIVGWQRALLDGLPPEPGPLLWSLAVGTLLLIGGFAYFTRAKDDFEAAL
ncbi:MAG TPA: ABC transporter permease [Candidatus Limnocylindria bacterium]|nr:ABC transporter permease [Candidatus Limnocylindria bacterium]